MFKKLGLVLASLLLAIATFAMSVAPATAATVEVDMGSTKGFPMQFVPNEVTISAGDTVKWVNKKMFPHNVIFEGDAADKSHKKYAYKPGESFTATFDQTGTYKYFCAPHRGAGMTGKVIVK
ncbi:MAG: plastocyanin [Moorea sp. SIO1F2]|uniref:plastocyanin n=1 Tax=unclassified Moorena TaxID=2683338 RepID=UPI0013BDFD6B|nr:MULTISPECIES: plastocyanin [unclassified Moorena]NEN94290.1 plastocyanin [Moorena sp. SIO3I7]NEO59108.1 plastocyanin [Moorena sp. SIO4G2]NEO12608.1 plastocyanin [Moorena sp. SIO3E8]NEP28907.1 plastocyanin [Moorena sp. SIO3I6]NEP97762.1 plastocyanin [Moorena sp. SIO3F7]